MEMKKVSPRLVRVVYAALFAMSLSCCYMIASSLIQHLPLRSSFLFNDGTVLGGDFIAFYVGGALFNQDSSLLYDLFEQRKLRIELMGASASGVKGELPFVYPPLVAVLFSILAKFNFPIAYVAWALLSFTACFFSAYVLSGYVVGGSRTKRCLVMSTFCGFLPFSMNTIMGGQLSWIGVCLCCWIFVALVNQRYFWAGLIMSFSYYKPPLFVVALIIMCLTMGKEFIGGFLVGGLLLVGMTLISVGTGGLASYLQVVSRYTYGQKVMADVELPTGQGAGIFALITTASPDATFSIIFFTICVVAVCFFLIKKFPGSLNTSEGAQWYGAVWLASVGLSLQCIRYDLAIIFVPMLLSLSNLSKMSSASAAFLICCVIAMYFEWLGRGLLLGGSIYNLSSILFLFILCDLLYHFHRSSRGHYGGK